MYLLPSTYTAIADIPGLAQSIDASNGPVSVCCTTPKRFSPPRGLLRQHQQEGMRILFVARFMISQ
jgi:hypothetical protein